MVPTSSHFLWAQHENSVHHLREEAPTWAWEPVPEGPGAAGVGAGWGDTGGMGQEGLLTAAGAAPCLLLPSLGTGRLPQGGQSLSRES